MSPVRWKALATANNVSMTDAAETRTTLRH
jgi:hypothetical protein